MRDEIRHRISSNLEKHHSLLRKRSVGFFVSIGIVILLVPTGWSKTIHVPGDSATIQAGINGAAGGDTVLVADGVYTAEGNRDIDFLGKSIVVRSENWPEVTIIDCEGKGRGFYFHSGEGRSSVLEGFTIQNGSAGNGAGIFCQDSSPTVNSCILKQGSAIHGGGIYCWKSSPVIANCTISQNSVYATQIIEALGGGILSWYSSSPTIANCIIVGNEGHPYPPWGVVSRGGGICCDSATIANCTIAANSADYAYEIFCDSSTKIANCIIWHSNDWENQIFGDPTILYSDVQGGWPGEGNIDTDPLFRDPDNGDYHLMATYCGDPSDSPCIDAGDPGILDDSLDCWHGLGTTRSDIGAYGGANAGWPTAVDEEENEVRGVPREFALFQNYPNPFNSETVLRYSLPQSGIASLTIYNVLGQQVATLVDGFKEAGQHSVVWDASGLSSGIYLARLEIGDYSGTIKLVLLQ